MTLRGARLGNIFTEQAYPLFQRLQFKNLLGRFEVEGPKNEVEDHFRIISSRAEAETVFERARKAERVGAAILKNTADVPPLFASQVKAGGAALCFGEEEIYCICAGEELAAKEILEKLGQTAAGAGCFAIFGLKEAMASFTPGRQDNCFDGIIAAYLLNPLKSDYTFEDVAREQLSLLLDEKREDEARACYEAYCAWKSQPILADKLEEAGMLGSLRR